MGLVVGDLAVPGHANPREISAPTPPQSLGTQLALRPGVSRVLEVMVAAPGQEGADMKGGGTPADDPPGQSRVAGADGETTLDDPAEEFEGPGRRTVVQLEARGRKSTW